MDKIAPIFDVKTENDFSSSSLLKNQGPNLTAELLYDKYISSGSDVKEIITLIL
jgi:hypothetical protein